MSRNDDGCSRRLFLGATASAAGTLTGIAGCSALPWEDEELDPPEYDDDVVADLFDAGFPSAPSVFPVSIPDARFREHEARATHLLDAVPSSPDVPNEAVAERIADDRARLADRFGDMDDVNTPRERLGRWRYYRTSAAEVWGAYVTATGQYSTGDFQTRFDRLRSEYNDFDELWNYRGSDPVTALVVHHAIEELVGRGRDAVLNTGPFPTEPKAAVFEAARMVENHEDAAAKIADARSYHTQYLDGQSNPASHRLRFVAATERMRYLGLEPPSDRGYNEALEHGREGLDADVGRGPAGEAFEIARRYAHGTERYIRRLTDQNHPATATLRAAWYKVSHDTFRAIVDAIRADEITWPEDEVGLRKLREETVHALETAWNTEPQPLAVELTAHPADALGDVDPRRFDSEIDEHDLARYVGTLHYAKRLLARIPDLTADVVDVVEAV